MIEWAGVYHIMATPFTDGDAICVRPPASALDAGTLDELTELLAAVVGR